MATDAEKTVGRPKFGPKSAEDEKMKQAMLGTIKQAREQEGPDAFPRREDVAKAIEEVRERKELAKASEWTVKDLADQYQIPKGLVLEINGKPYVTKEGLLIQARRIGYDSIEATVTEVRDGWFESEGRVYRSLKPQEVDLLSKINGQDKETFWRVYQDLRRPTVAHATANPDNVKMGAMKAYMRELAETRAINRALRLFTGCGLVSADELEDTGQRGVSVSP
jgi:hypothetical protein